MLPSVIGGPGRCLGSLDDDTRLPEHDRADAVGDVLRVRAISACVSPLRSRSWLKLRQNDGPSCGGIMGELALQATKDGTLVLTITNGVGQPAQVELAIETIEKLKGQ